MAQTRELTFPDGDYPQRLNEIWAALEAAMKDEQAGEQTLLAGEPTTVEKLAEDYKALRAEAKADAEAKRRVVTLRAVGRGKWRELKQRHAPRSGEGVDEESAKADRVAGVNTETVGDDLLFASIQQPMFSSRGDFDDWLDELSEGEFNVLLLEAWSLVNGASFNPKSPPSSPTRNNGTS